MIYMDEMVSGTMFAVVWGLGYNIQQVALTFVMPHFYGTKCLGTINSVFVTSNVLGTAIGPIAYGMAIDKTGSWSTILWSTVPIALLSGLMLTFCATKP